MQFITRALLAALLFCVPSWADDTSTERVQFQESSNSARVQGTIKGYDSVDYVFGARKGQSMNVSLSTNNRANDFNIIAPGKQDEAMFVGSKFGNQFEGTLPASGDYKVRVYLMDSSARRNEAAKYWLEMIIE
jgi:hypothetical protein